MGPWDEWAKQRAESIKGMTEEEVAKMGGKDSPMMSFINTFNTGILGFASFFLPGLVKLIPEGFSEMSDVWKKKYGQGIKKSAADVLEVLQRYGMIDESGVKMLNDLTKTFGAFQTPLLIGAVIMTVANYLRGMVQATMGKVMQQYNTAFSPFALDASSAVRAAFVAPADYKLAYDALRRNGLSDADISLLFKSAYSMLDTDTLRTLYFRGEMTMEQVTKEMRSKGFTDDRIAKTTLTWKLIPPVSDLITMSVREAFSEDQVRSLGLDEAFPAEVAQWGAKQGLDENWTRKYWRAHWTLPSATMGYEMLHRGIIDDGQLRDLLKALDYSPRWHDPLMAISHNVMTRVDARRLFELGLLSEEELTVKYKEMGYSEADAVLLTRWTVIEYNQEYKDLTKNEIIKQYQEGIISETECYSFLQMMGFALDRIETMLALANYQRAYAKQTALIGALKKLYISGQYTSSDVNQELSPYNIDPRRIDELIDTWNVERKAGITLPKKTELDDWLGKGIINSTEYVEEMRRIGYSDKNIDRYVKSLTFKSEGK